MSGIVSSEAHKPAKERRTNHGRGFLIVLIAAMTVVAPLLLPMTAYYLNLLMQTSTYAVAVVGLTIVLGYTGQINLAQAAFFGFGAYSVGLGIADGPPAEVLRNPEVMAAYLGNIKTHVAP